MYKALGTLVGIVALLYLSSYRVNDSSSNVEELGNNLKGEYTASIVKKEGDKCILSIDDKYITTYGGNDKCQVNKRGLATISKTGRFYTLQKFTELEQTNDQGEPEEKAYTNSNGDTKETVTTNKGDFTYIVSPEGDTLMGKVVGTYQSPYVVDLDTANYVEALNGNGNSGVVEDYNHWNKDEQICAYGNGVYITIFRTCPTDYTTPEY